MFIRGRRGDFSEDVSSAPQAAVPTTSQPLRRQIFAAAAAIERCHDLGIPPSRFYQGELLEGGKGGSKGRDLPNWIKVSLFFPFHPLFTLKSAN